MANWAQGIFEVKNPDKYIGNHKPKYRSGWEFTFMQFCDNNKNVLKWASEALSIPYRKAASIKDRMIVAVNHAKWAAAKAYCKQNGFTFRVVTEEDLFYNGRRK